MAQAAPPAPPTVNQASLQQIVDMGFSAARAELALRRVRTQLLHVALDSPVHGSGPGGAPASHAWPAHAVNAGPRLLLVMLLPTTAGRLHQLWGRSTAGTPHHSSRQKF